MSVKGLIPSDASEGVNLAVRRATETAAASTKTIMALLGERLGSDHSSVSKTTFDGTRQHGQRVADHKEHA
jgi:hypothetical protein